MKKIILLFLSAILLNAKSLVVLEPSAVEILLKLGAKDNILAIAKTQSSKIEPEYLSKDLDSVGTYIRVNMEKIISLNPDLVLYSHHSLNVEQLDKFNIKRKSIEANNLEDIKQNIKFLAQISNKESNGEKLLLEFNNYLSKTKNVIKNKSAIIVFSANPLMLFCSNNLANDVINHIGVKNICTQKEQSPIVNIEYILSSNPDVIIYFGNKEELIKQYPLLKLSKAYKDNKILTSNSASLLRASYNITKTISTLIEQIQ
ncbi:ABC transporter substrate-binding protein [Campylobacter canadensis]|uniref:ABC transporter substrate-binding protein n=1 Tax=Campylobacter canadensis TaxID=449520 RepID=A0ABS7WPH9_9BACT|nr:ABC transporter substrate-binding protein [Campylobacter canadensis]MBZ7986673.1 ABC transporter substrate-binding protein [Campylobacter canadensis]MBZ7993922.1 ABC transporter substrate-binding protein [Campylobacter canadensis]MBZ7996238.1 ABC transporter substrate-binding protein [Campylobacter canadensis]MBZ7997709.1 ABC transporter substrate-binding protein [Campylobacter canadensis]MBZ7999255.1 ABC transporter substrate-binding protein [Campylobacter canadensis]